MKTASPLACGLAAAAAAFHVQATGSTSEASEQIQVKALDCRRGVSVVARQAAMTDVLLRLSSIEGFRLTMDEPIEQRLDMDVAQPTYDILVRLLAARNFIITQRADRRCPGRLRVARIWVLKNGEPPAPNMPRGVLPATNEYVTPEAREQDTLYRRAHGMLPEQDGEDAGKKSP